jgi:hypothetical protein
MLTPPTSDAVQSKLKRLTTAVWILAVLLCVALLGCFLVARWPSIARSEFDRLSPEQRIKSSSVIALAKWNRSDSTLRCIISEILKQDLNTPFYYKVGDEYREHSRQVRANTDYGDGEVLFFSGSPPRLELATAYRDDRVTTFGDMPLDTLREMIGASK